MSVQLDKILLKSFLFLTVKLLQQVFNAMLCRLHRIGLQLKVCELIMILVVPVSTVTILPWEFLKFNH